MSNKNKKGTLENTSVPLNKIMFDNIRLSKEEEIKSDYIISLVTLLKSIKNKENDTSNRIKDW
jgi:hypothetical protein